MESELGVNHIEYCKMLQRQGLRSLVGILATIDFEKYPERASAVREEIERRKINGESVEEIHPVEAVPKWKIQKNWYKINALMVGILSATSFYSTFTATESGFFLNFVELSFGIVGLTGILLYFWKFELGHKILLFWWLPQLVEIETPTYKYSLYSGFRFGVEFRFGPLEISTNLIAIVSFAWLVLFKNYYGKRVKEESMESKGD